MEVGDSPAYGFGMTTTTTPTSTSGRRISVAAAAWAAAGSFLGLALTIGARNGAPPPEIPDGLARLGAMFGVAMHVALVPVVAALPAPRWARRAGFTWLAVDTATNLATLAGAHDTVTTAVRLAGHLPAAVWIAAIAVRGTGTRRVLGLALAVWLGTYTLVAPVVPDAAFIPAVPLMLVWLVLVARDAAIIPEPPRRVPST